MSTNTEKLIEEMSNAYQGNVQRMDELEARINRQGLNTPANTDPRDEARQFYAMKRNVAEQPVSNAEIEAYKSYREAFAQYLAKGPNAISTEVSNALRVGSDPDGGYLVTPDSRGRIVQRMFDTSPIRQIANVQPFSGGDSLEGFSDTADIGGGWVAEMETRDETDGPTFGKYDITAHEVYAMPSITQKMADDAVIDILNYVERSVGRKLGRLEATAFVTGNGVGKPRGFMDYASASVTTDDDSRDWGVLQYVATGASAGFPKNTSTEIGDDATSLIDLVAALKPEYRANARFVMNRQTAAVVRKLRDNDGKFLWSDSLIAGQPNMLLGYPVVEAEDMADIGANSYSIAFGDFESGYTIADRFGMRILRDPFTTKGKIKLYTWRRVGGDIVDTDAIKLLKFGSS